MKVKHARFICPICGAGCIKLAGLKHECTPKLAQPCEPKQEEQKETKETKTKKKRG